MQEWEALHREARQLEGRIEVSIKHSRSISAVVVWDGSVGGIRVEEGRRRRVADFCLCFIYCFVLTRRKGGYKRSIATKCNASTAKHLNCYPYISVFLSLPLYLFSSGKGSSLCQNQ